MEDRNILCIDLKSFFASVECVLRGLDPYKHSLVVANPHQGNGAITLAITPHLKNQGIKSRSRLYEIPNHIKYQIVPPRSKVYREYSKKVVDVYLNYISSDDLVIYSIDECFLDVTNYLKLYKKTDEEIAQDILKKIHHKTGLTATCGIGPNIFMAKVAMDTEAKKNESGIAKWSKNSLEKHLWPIKPLSKIWGIGPKMEKKLNNLGIYSVNDLVKHDKNILINKFGDSINELLNDLNGINNRSIQSMNKAPKDKSYSISSSFLSDLNSVQTDSTINNIADSLAEKLLKNNKEASTINFKITFSKDYGGFINKSINYPKGTSSAKDIYNFCWKIYEDYYENEPIRKVEVHLFGIKDKLGKQLNLFDNNNFEEDKITSTILDIKNKYGTEIITKAINISKEK